MLTRIPLVARAFRRGPPPVIQHPNEPSGYVVVADNPFDAVVADGWNGWSVDRLSIQQDPTEPMSPPNYGACLFPEGFVGGSGPINLEAPPIDSRIAYFHWSFGVSDPWVNHTAGTKMLFVTDTGGGDTLFTLLSGQGPAGAVLLEVRTQGTGHPDNPAVNYLWNGATNGAPNGVNPQQSDAEFTRGGPMREVEMLLVYNTPGNDDGEIHVWIDGVQTHEYTGQRLSVSGAIGQLFWNPTFGGGDSDSVDADQYQNIGHFYISRAAS